MTRGTRLVFLLAACAWSVLVAGVARGQDSIRVRERVERALPGAITLADVAELSGEGASRLGALVVMENAGAGETTLSVETIRGLLEARDDVNWGRLELRGSVCRVWVGKPEVVKPKAPAAKAGTEPAPIPDGPIVRRLIEERVLAELRLAAGDVRLSFDERDAELLNTSVVGRASDIALVGTSPEQPVSVTLYEGEKIAASGTVRVGVRVRRMAAVLAEDLKRGEAVTSAAVTGEERWLPHTVECVPVEGAIGRVAKGSLPRGRVLEAADVQAPLVVKKGELVRVHCVNGSFVVKTTARALGDGRQGELVTLQPVGSARTFQARMDAPGIAVLASTGGDDSLAPGARQGRVKDVKERATRAASAPVSASDEDRAARRARDARARGYADLADRKLGSDDATQKAADKKPADQRSMAKKPSTEE
ncbi:MAG: flagellar basal body P-ring formation protein FlgA [Phycisphaerae bacterium]|nr:flagellar basal body P-ring formation protein FlgA [Phycisphaerae bacterium]